MRLLLDTHLLLWVLNEPERLGGDLIALIQDPVNEVLFSAVSIWEIAIKARLGRPDFQASPEKVLEGLLDADFVEAPIASRAAIKVADLPFHHRDPFDRLLVAQAMTTPARLFTSDRQLAAYSELVTVV